MNHPKRDVGACIAGRGIDFGLERVALERRETRWATGLDEISFQTRYVGEFCAKRRLRG
jgi:hypothetical protein